MGWLSKAFKSVVKGATLGAVGALYRKSKDKEKAAKAAAAQKLVQQQQAAEMMQATEQGAGTKLKQQTRAASLLGSYAPDQTTLLG